MWFNKKKVEEPKTETVNQEMKIEEPKETKRDVIMSLVLINNKTDKEYVIKSENDFGLSWEFVGQANMRYQLLVINQHTTENKQKWRAVGRFTDFSIVKSVWETFENTTPIK